MFNNEIFTSYVALPASVASPKNKTELSVLIWGVRIAMLRSLVFLSRHCFRKCPYIGTNFQPAVVPRKVRWLICFVATRNVDEKLGVESEHCAHLDLRRRGKGRKLAWQRAWHENTKVTAQLRSFFVDVDKRV